MSGARAAGRPAFWVAGDWNGFFGLFTNVVLNVIVLTGLCLGVVKLPEDIVFGRILPALGVALPLGNLFYGWMAWRLARQEGRNDVTALPYGPSVPHMFIVVFVVMLPVYLKTQNPLLAWQAGLAWAFIIGLIILAGAFVGPTVRKYTPRAAMLGALAGISVAFISLRPAFQSWQVPWLAFLSLGIILVSWMARVRLPWGLPGGLAAVLVGTVLAWGATFAGISPQMDPAAVGAALGQFGWRPPLLSEDVLQGLADIAPLLVTAVPLGIYNFTEAMNNVESASAAGDEYGLRKVLVADGIGALAGSILGSPFPPAVYIGHPGWKSVGGRIGYSLATGVVISAVCFLGLTALLLAVVPLVSILPILLYIGLVIGAQAFEATPARHAPAVILAMLPNVAEWAQTQVDGALAAAGTSAAQVGFDKLAANGVIYHGMQLFGGGATLAGLMLGAIAAYIIDRRFDRAGAYAAIGAALAFFGFINGTSLGFANSAPVALGYALLALICVGLARMQVGPAPIAGPEAVEAGNEPGSPWPRRSQEGSALCTPAVTRGVPSRSDPSPKEPSCAACLRTTAPPPEAHDMRGVPSHDTQGVPSHDTQGVPSHDTQGVPSHVTRGVPSHDTRGVPSHDSRPPLETIQAGSDVADRFVQQSDGMMFSPQTPDPATTEALIDAAAALLGIPVDPAWRASIRAHLETTLRHAACVAAFDLPDEADPAPVFRA